MRNFTIFLIALMTTPGCSTVEKQQHLAEPERLWKTSPKAKTEIYSIVLTQLSEFSIHINVTNISKQAICLDTYYFGYQVELIDTAGKSYTYDFGADKVPVSTDGDWHLLRQMESFGRIIDLPREMPTLSNIKSITLRSSGSESVKPSWLKNIREPVQLVEFEGQWDKAN